MKIQFLCNKTNGSENDFMQNIYGPNEVLFWCRRLQGTNDNILVF